MCGGGCQFSGTAQKCTLGDDGDLQPAVLWGIMIDNGICKKQWTTYDMNSPEHVVYSTRKFWLVYYINSLLLSYTLIVENNASDIARPNQ